MTTQSMCRNGCGNRAEQGWTGFCRPCFLTLHEDSGGMDVDDDAPVSVAPSLPTWVWFASAGIAVAVVVWAARKARG